MLLTPPNTASTALSAALRRDVRRSYIAYGGLCFMADLPIWSFFFIEHCQLSLAQAVALHALTFFSQGLFDLPTSSWADRFGRKPVLVLGIWSRIIATILSIVWPTLASLTVAALLFGFGWAQISGTFEALFYDNLKHEGQETRFSALYANVPAANYSARICAFALSGVLFVVSPTLPFCFMLAGLLISLLFVYAIEERPYNRSEARNTFAQVAQATRILSSTPGMRSFVVVSLLVGGIAEQLWMLFQPLLTHAGLGPELSGLSFAIGAIGSLGTNRVAKRLNAAGREPLALGLSALCFGIGGLLFSVASETLLAITAQFVLCLGYGFIYLSTSALMNRRLPSTHRATAISVYGSIRMTALGLFGAGSGFLFEKVGAELIPLFAGLTCLVSIPYLVRAARAVKLPVEVDSETGNLAV